MSYEIRPSTVSSMMLCPARMQLREDVLPILPAEALVFGSVVHARIEAHLEGRGEQDVNALLAWVWSEDTDGRLIDNDIDKDRQQQLVREVNDAYDAWWRQVRPFLPTSKAIVEERMCSTLGYHPIDNRAVTMCGTPDVVYPDEHLIIDWKTAGRGWDKQKVEGQVQPMAYNVLVNDNLDSSETYAFTFYVYDRQKGNWKKHEYGKPEMTAIDAFIEQAFGMGVLLYSEPVYTPAGQGRTSRGWHCSPKYCDVWGICPGRKLIKDGKQNQRATRLHEKGWG